MFKAGDLIKLGTIEPRSGWINPENPGATIITPCGGKWIMDIDPDMVGMFLSYDVRYPHVIWAVFGKDVSRIVYVAAADFVPL